MAMMKAVEFESCGGPEVLQVANVEKPKPGPTEILVKVHAAGVNPVDWKTRATGGFLAHLQPPPYRLGWDVSGVVEAVGQGVTRFEPGDEVIGMPRFPHQAGCYAEYVTGPSRQFALKPPQIDHVEAAGLPLAGLTAWQALVDTAKVSPGQRVLILGAAGGVGHLAVQIAKYLDCYVIGTSQGVKHDFLSEMGIDEAIDYTSSSPAEVPEPYDVIIDLIGGDTGLDALAALKPGCIYIPIPSREHTGTADRARERGFRVYPMLVEPDGHALERLSLLVQLNKLRVEINTVFPLEQAADAHRFGEQGRTRGKIVLRI
jgi:NADPH:quinone reductase-like Zn-dependent oxidoreductase